MANDFIHWLSWLWVKPATPSPFIRGVIADSAINESNVYITSKVTIDVQE